MSRGVVWLSDAAAVDVVEQADWYERSSGPELASRWEKDVEAALIRIEKNPSSGARCGFRPTELQDVRRMPIEGFPKHLILYQADSTKITILRVVHGARDLERLI
jgi:toxin ParE1/3/4